MKTLLTLLVLLCSSLAAHAGEPAQRPQQEATARTSGDPRQLGAKGALKVELKLAASGLKIGPNSFELVVRDPAGRPVEGARLSVTPWMPTMGHGVWEKPVVKEAGGGNYHVDNVIIIMGGLWELKVALSKGAVEDGVVFSATVAEANLGHEEPEKARTGYDRTLADYNIPNVTLIDQDGKKVNLRVLFDSRKPVIVDFIFTTCTTVCPVLSAGFSNLRRSLGAEADKVQLVSISIDPENDRPEKMKRYLQRFGGDQGWEFLTGSREDVGRVLRAFNAFVVDKMSHEPLYLLHAPDAAQWVRIKGLIKKSDLLSEYRRTAK